MNYEVNNKVEAIKNDISNNDGDNELEEYKDENSDYQEQYKNKTFNNNNDNKDELKKKLIKAMIIIGGGMLILLLILFLITTVFGKKYTYEDVEDVMISAAKSYFNENKKMLPSDDNQNVEIEISNLVANEKMKSLDKYLGEEHGCSGKVQVKKSDEDYTYTPFLSCGKKYSTKFLADTITKDENLVGSGYGLYLVNDNYVFRGENLNNYVQLDAKLWQIVKVNSDKTITLVLSKTENYEYPYDDRYNQTVDFDNGINNYETSRVREQLQQMYKETKEDEQETYILSENDKKHLVKFDVCTGKMALTEAIYDNSVECTQTLSEKIGLLTVTDYINASIDTNCNKIDSSNCQNYNYLADTGSFWLVTPSNKDTYSVYKVSSGVIRDSVASETSRIRPVITLDANTLLKEGNGSKETPYILR